MKQSATFCGEQRSDKPLTTNFLFLLFKPIMVKVLSLPLVSKHGITFPRISGLLTQNTHLVQNTLHIYTVSTKKFDLNELRETVVYVWQFFVDHELQIVIMRRLYTWKWNAFGILFLVEEFCSLWPVVLVLNCCHRKLTLSLLLNAL